ncbi:hypothetical protein [Variovorax sp. PAMC 28711]|uniref:hypothetical protein n=1 Tax=Variovorax sp. PAMC 28711 TaxID=1795631 RepID=UPI0014392432|nr:hypothetical protein [Variovorax sp. PAMC 28711]
MTRIVYVATPQVDVAIFLIFSSALRAGRSASSPTRDGNAAMQPERMTDPRNVAHDKKVQQEKKHRGEEVAPDAEHAPQPGMKPALKHSGEKADDAADDKGEGT